MTELISVVEAAARQQPFVGDINAPNLLKDWQQEAQTNPLRNVRHGAS